MANRPRGYGLSAELARKKAEKFDADVSSDCMYWIRDVLVDGGYNNEAAKIITEVRSEKDIVASLKDGQILCKLVNVIVPGSVKKINESTMVFKQMENINNFLTACEKMGCKKLDLFQSVDLYESQNIPQVINGILALGRKAQTIGYDGPCLGPTEATENKREFTEQQLRASEGIIGLQAGSNQGATQSGLNFGKTRAIID